MSKFEKTRNNFTKTRNNKENLPMKRPILLLLACAAVALIAVAPKTLGQDEQVKKLKGYFLTAPVRSIDAATLQAQSDAGAGLKVWTYKATSTRVGSKGQKFTGVMVGNSPYTNKGTTTTTMQVVPLIITIGSTVFDPTKPDNACAGGKVPLTLYQNSPIIKPASFTMNGVNVGKTSYTDAFQRASFWTPVNKNGGTYHNKLKLVTLKPVKVNLGSHSAILTNTCGPLGGVDINEFEPLLEQTIIPGLGQGVNPKTFVTFLMYNVVMYEGTTSNCCILGYHFGIGSPVQTYSPFEFDTTKAFGSSFTDAYIAAHEVDEWQDDPLGNNAVPAWGHVGQVSGCQGNLEVGDPLTGGGHPFTVPLGGYTYHLQELAMYSWFFGPPSIGAGKKFSDNGTFTSAQGACTN
jgi:hypothetical protein